MPRQIEFGIPRTFDRAVDDANSLIVKQAIVQLAKANLIDYDPEVYKSLPLETLMNIADTCNLPTKEVRNEVKKILCTHMVDEINKKAGMGEQDQIMRDYVREKKDIIDSWEPNLTGPSLTKLGNELNETLARINGATDPNADKVTPTTVAKVSAAVSAVTKVENEGRMDELTKYEEQKVHLGRISAAAKIIRETPVAERAAITDQGLRSDITTQDLRSAFSAQGLKKTDYSVGNHLGANADDITKRSHKLLATERPLAHQARDVARNVGQDVRDAASNIKQQVSALYDKFVKNPGKKDAPQQEQTHSLEQRGPRK